MTDFPFLVQGLTKSYGGREVVRQLDLAVPRGSIFGLVGPNGCGKTTLISMATGLIRPDAGRATICGVDVWSNPTEAKKHYGLLADGLVAFDRLSGKELLEYSGALRGMDPAVVDKRGMELLAALGLAGAGAKPIVDYSAGMTKKVYLANALLHNPPMLILDEPLEAVDPASGRVIQQILRNYAAAGGTVLMSSHVMELVEGLCDHVAIMKDGRVLVAGSVDEVRQGRSLTDLFVELAGGGTLAAGSLDWLKGE